MSKKNSDNDIFARLLLLNKQHDKGKDLILDEDYEVLLKECTNRVVAGGSNINLNELHNNISKKKSYHCSHPSYIRKIGKRYNFKALFSRLAFISVNTYIDLLLEPKIDGILINVIYFEGKCSAVLSRGDQYGGKNLTSLLCTLFPQRISFNTGIVQIRCELFVTNNIYKEFYSHFSYARGAVISILSKNNVEDSFKFLSYFVTGFVINDTNHSLITDVYDLLKKDGFKIVEHVRCSLDGLEESIDAQIFNKNLPMDGLIVKFNSIQFKNHLLAKYADYDVSVLALKPVESCVSTIIDIEYSTNKSGIFSPLAIIKEVIVGDLKINRVNIYSYNFVVVNNIKVGSVISIIHRGIVVFDTLISSPEHVEFKHIAECTGCNQKIQIINKHYVCANLQCRHKFIYAISAFAANSGIKSLAIKTIEKLYDHKIICDLLDVFNIEKNLHRLVRIPGIGNKIANTIVSNFKSIVTKIDLGNILELFNLPTIGRKTSSAVIAHILQNSNKSLDELHLNKNQKSIVINFMNDAHSISMLKCILSKLSDKRAFSIIPMFPYPSGNLHMGHLRNYVYGDILARFYRAIGKEVIHEIGWDAFGLPAENAAILHNIQPSIWTHSNISSMNSVLKSLSLSYNWSNLLNTCSEDYILKNQELFSLLFKKGLIYRKKSFVNWDPVDQSVLSNEQVINGRGWRSNAIVQRKIIDCYFFKMRSYAEKLLDFADINHNKAVSSVQRNWIKKHTGLDICLPILNTNKTITLFTKKKECFKLLSCIAIAINHDLAIEHLLANNIIVDYEHMEDFSCKTNLYVSNPYTNQPIPIIISSRVINNYGTGAIYVSPSVSELDKKISDDAGIACNMENTAVDMEEASRVLDSYSSSAVHYKLQDWCINRQRMWGCPIPVYYCQHCNKDDIIIDSKINTQRLSYKTYKDLVADPIYVKCQTCNNNAKVSNETLDTFFDSSWYFLVYLSRGGVKDMDLKSSLEKLPLNIYIGGAEHNNLHILYARAFCLALRDICGAGPGKLFEKIVNQGAILKRAYTVDGKYVAEPLPGISYESKTCKMSKSKFNTVNVEDMLKKYSSCILRLAIIMDYSIVDEYVWDESKPNLARKTIYKITKGLSVVDVILLLDDFDVEKYYKEDIIKDMYVIALYGVKMYVDGKINNVLAAINKLMNFYYSNMSKYNNSNRRYFVRLLVALSLPIIPTTVIENTKYDAYKDVNLWRTVLTRDDYCSQTDLQGRDCT